MAYADGPLPTNNHEDRVDIDREIERRTGVYCDDAIEKGLVSKSEFKDIVYSVLGRKRKRREAIEAWLFRRFFHNIHVSTIKHD